MVRFKTGAGCRDTKASPKSQISNGFRQLIWSICITLSLTDIVVCLYLFYRLPLPVGFVDFFAPWARTPTADMPRSNVFFVLNNALFAAFISSA